MTLSIATSLSELPEYRQVLANLIARDLKVKYQSKALGFAWSLLAPAAMLAILYTIFSRAFKNPMPDYWAFLIAGILPFQFISESIVTGAGSIRASAGLIRKVYLPMEILVVAAITVKAIEFVLQMLLAVTLLLILHHGLGSHERLVPDPEIPGAKTFAKEMWMPDGKVNQQRRIIPPAAAKFMDQPPHFAPLKALI